MEPRKSTREHLARFIAAGLAEVGEHTYGSPDIRFPLKGIKVRIGDYCSIAEGVSIFMGGGHRPDWVSTYPFAAFPDEWPTSEVNEARFQVGKGDVVIGNDVWIGAAAWIGSGVTIGDGAVIAMRSIVVKDVPPYTIVGGNPAQIIRQRFPTEIVEALCEIRWWEWEPAKIAENLPLLMSDDLQAFVDAHRPR